MVTSWKATFTEISLARFLKQITRLTQLVGSKDHRIHWVHRTSRNQRSETKNFGVHYKIHDIFVQMAAVVDGRQDVLLSTLRMWDIVPCHTSHLSRDVHVSQMAKSLTFKNGNSGTPARCNKSSIRAQCGI